MTMINKPESTRITIDDIQRVLGKYISHVKDNVPAEREDIYMRLLFSTINNKYTLLVHSHRTKDLITQNAGLKAENEKLRQALKSVEESIDNAHGEVQSAESYLMTASTTIDKLNLDD